MVTSLVQLCKTSLQLLLWMKRWRSVLLWTSSPLHPQLKLVHRNSSSSMLNAKTFSLRLQSWKYDSSMLFPMLLQSYTYVCVFFPQCWWCTTPVDTQATHIYHKVLRAFHNVFQRILLSMEAVGNLVRNCKLNLQRSKKKNCVCRSMQEAQKVFPAEHPIEHEPVKNKVSHQCCIKWGQQAYYCQSANNLFALMRLHSYSFYMVGLLYQSSQWLCTEQFTYLKSFR